MSRWMRFALTAGWTLLAGLGAIAIFYLVWLPENYFGGSTFVGNRYFLTSYAALLIAAPVSPCWCYPGEYAYIMFDADGPDVETLD